MQHVVRELHPEPDGHKELEKANARASPSILEKVGIVPSGKRIMLQKLTKPSGLLDMPMQCGMCNGVVSTLERVWRGSPVIKWCSTDSKVGVAQSFGQVTSAEQMLEFLDSIWKLQLTANRQGDEVKFINDSTLQPINAECMTFQNSGLVAGGFVKVTPSGSVGDTWSFMRIDKF